MGGLIQLLANFTQIIYTQNMVVRMRHTRSHTNNRRSHHSIADRSFSVCEKCKAPKLNHSACTKCGAYKGRVVLDIQAKIDKKLKKQKAREKVAR